MEPPSWSTIAVVVALVAPMYGIVGGILWRQGLLRGLSSDMDDNEGDISDLEDRLRKLEREVALLRKDHRMLHDHTTEENHCGSEDCRFCEVDTDGPG